MKLNEFVDKNGNKINLNSPAVSNQTSTGSSNTGFKKRFEKLLAYHIMHRRKTVDDYKVIYVSEDTFHYKEHHTSPKEATIEIIAFIGERTGAWRLQVFGDGNKLDDLSGMEWVNLIKALRTYLNLPTTGTPEYKNLLTEWVDKNGNKVSLNNSSSQATSNTSTKTTKTNKEKFEELTKYMQKHKDSEVTIAQKTKLTDTEFYYEEFHEPTANGKGYYVEVAIKYSRFTASFHIEIVVAGKPLEDHYADNWEDLLRYLKPYFNVPYSGSKEHKSLCEWVDSNGNKVNLNNSSMQSASKTSTKNYPDQTYRYKKLLAQIDADGLFRKYHINLLDDRILAVELGNGVGVKIIFKPYVPCYLVQVAGEDTTCTDWTAVLKHLIIEGIIGDTDLCESASFADDFKTYENLWN